jgi:hypothetical protein
MSGSGPKSSSYSRRNRPRRQLPTEGAIWYFSEAYKLTEHVKFLLMTPSTDRSWIGFHRVVDSE